MNAPSQNRSYRYRTEWAELFAAHYRPFLQADMVLLDIGAGRTPVIPPEQRPAGCTYIGLDISADEMNRAPPSAYDEIIIGDIVLDQPELSEKVDLAVARQVLEHVDDVSSALNSIHSALKDGGHFVALLSGRNAHFAVINRLIPEALGKYGMRRLLGRQPDSVFRAHYDHCTHSGLSGLMTEWELVSITPLYAGSGYLSFSPLLRATYLRYEDWASRTNRLNLATHYILDATK